MPDCFGFVQFICSKANIDLPRSSSEQAREGTMVTRSLDFAKLRPGGLLFFSRGRRHVGHVGIYLGEGKMIHATTWRLGVTISDLLQSSYRDSFVVAKRFFILKEIS
jgi:cell wall-associated NlpC family hydrolase